MTRARHSIHGGIAALCALGLELAGPAGATSTGLVGRGPADEQVIVASVATPYPDKFYLTTDVKKYPSLDQIDTLDGTTSATAGSAFLTMCLYCGGARENYARSSSSSDGTFWAAARTDEWYVAQNAGYSGTLADTYWSRTYRKDDLNATLNFTVSTASLDVYAIGGHARAEFTYEVRLFDPTYSASQPLVYFFDDAGLMAQDLDEQILVTDGPMTYTTSKPRGYGNEHVAFDPYTGNISLEGIIVGGEFRIEFIAMTMATIDQGEVEQASAFFRDPVSSSGGFSVSTSGLTVVPEPAELCLVAAALAALGVSRRRVLA